MDMKQLDFESCGINDDGLQALSRGAANHCKVLDLSENNSITPSGLRYLSTSLQSDSCRLENLCLGRMNIGDDGAEVLARGLIGNKSLRCLHFRGEFEDDIAITRAGWSAFSAVLCDTSTVNNTYLSNHTVQELWSDYHADEDFDIDEEIVLYLQLNHEHPQYAARCKILMKHTHLDMVPFLRWGLKCLPLAVGWYERAKPCTTLSIYEDDSSRRRQVLDEPEQVYQSRVLTALYEFVRGVPKKVLERRDELALVAAYDDKIAMVEEENKRLRKDNKRLLENVEERDEKIAQKNKRLCSILESRDSSSPPSVGDAAQLDYVSTSTHKRHLSLKHFSEVFECRSAPAGPAPTYYKSSARPPSHTHITIDGLQWPTLTTSAALRKMSSRYQIKRLWNGIAPILTTNLIETGVVEAAANDSLTLAAVTAFDRYTNSSLTSTAAAQDVDAASPANNRRRRRRPSSQAKESAVDISIEPSTASTPNDNFFEYQRRMGYALDNHQSDNLLRQQLKEKHIIDAIIFYLQHFHSHDDGERNAANNLPQQRLTSSIIHELQSDSPELTIDLWAAVQRGDGAHHKFHVHEGAVVSGVYYSNCPLGCAPLVLKRPTLDSGSNLEFAQNANNNDDAVERDDDEVIHPSNGQLVLFPPWLNHGVPLAKEQKCIESSASLPRVSWAFNLNARLAYVGNAWDVTRP
eukprot:scaffold18651_cov70-Skeletonema_dohrnii-CCMP3373.AAC.3